MTLQDLIDRCRDAGMPFDSEFECIHIEAFDSPDDIQVIEPDEMRHPRWRILGA